MHSLFLFGQDRGSIHGDTITGIGTDGRGMIRSGALGIHSGIPAGIRVGDLVGARAGILAGGVLVGDRAGVLATSMWTLLRELGNLHPQDLISGLRTALDSGLVVPVADRAFPATGLQHLPAMGAYLLPALQ